MGGPYYQRNRMEPSEVERVREFRADDVGIARQPVIRTPFDGMLPPLLRRLHRKLPDANFKLPFFVLDLGEFSAECGVALAQ